MLRYLSTHQHGLSDKQPHHSKTFSRWNFNVVLSKKFPYCYTSIHEHTTSMCNEIMKHTWKNLPLKFDCTRFFRSISVCGQLPTYPSLNPTLTLTCCQLTVVELGEILILIQFFYFWFKIF